MRKEGKFYSTSPVAPSGITYRIIFARPYPSVSETKNGTQTSVVESRQEQTAQ